MEEALREATEELESNKKHLQLEIAEREAELQHKERQLRITEV